LYYHILMLLFVSFYGIIIIIAHKKNLFSMSLYQLHVENKFDNL
jgi:hypothetical protein